MSRRVGDTSGVMDLFPIERAQDERHQQLVSEHTGLGPDDIRQVSYVPSAFVQTVLPYRDMGSVAAWAKGNGRVSMMINAGNRVVNMTKMDARGRKVRESVAMTRGLPYGSLPRIILSWLATEAITTQQRRIQLGLNRRDFMSRLGCQSFGGGDAGNVTRTFEQATRLFSSTISLVRNNVDITDLSLSGMPGLPIVDRCDILAESADASDMGGSSLVLSQWFYDEVTKHGVPCDFDALSRLRNSALALDIYSFLTWRYSFLAAPKLISWHEIYNQFSDGAVDPRRFRQTFRAALKHVLHVYPQAQVEDKVNSEGLLLLPSPTHIQAKSKPLKRSQAAPALCLAAA